MFDAERLLGQLLKGTMSGALGGSRGRKKRGGSVLSGLGMGTKAQLGVGLLGVAIAAYDHYVNKPGAAPASPVPGAGLPPQAPVQMPPPPPGAPPRATTAQQDQRSRDMVLLIQAMVAAAAADGHIDEVERGQILQRANDAGLDAETRRFLEAELSAPKSVATIVAAARPELAPDIYAASCVAINPDTDAERSYLDTLASRLNLSVQTRQTIHQQLGMA